jgi:asparagine synthase (glutamine-hydrolysing)
MCGFAGIVAWDDRYRFDRGTLARMSARIAHRGPDGEGLWINHEGEVNAGHPQVGLAHRRLAIIDLDERANQPFTDGRGRWLAFNGEIYNYRELRKELERLLPDYAWRTQSDTEVLLASYAAWGEKCVEHLNGMFAFAVWDEPNGQLFLARDRMGQKPLYLLIPKGDASNALAFASEIDVLREISWYEQCVTSSQAFFYLRWGNFHNLHTAFSNVHELPPGHTKLCPPQTNIFPGRRYFDVFAAGSNQEPLRDADARRTTRERVTHAVRRQLVADVPVGCFLSGGIDSSVVAAAMRQSLGPGQRMLTFSIGFDDPRYDETRHAREVARLLNTEHHEFRVTPNAVEDLPKLAGVFGAPFADSSALPTHYLARETRRHVKVALSGDGGDELFGGYDRYRALALTERLAKLPQALRAALVGPVVQSIPGVHPKARGTRLKRMLRSVNLPPGERYDNFIELFDDKTARELVGFEGNYVSPVDAAVRYATTLGKTVVQAGMCADRYMYLPNDLLTKVDRCSMLHALEVRSPFMDHELVEFAATLTTPQLLKGGPKRMLREAFADVLPAWVFKRKKMGFAVPIGEWFRGELRPMLHDHLFAKDAFAATHFSMAVVRRLVDDHEAGRVDHSQRLYALLMLELWWRNQQ